MKCLITGANGVVGKNIYSLLESRSDFDVCGAGRSQADLRSYFVLDLTDKSSVLDLFAKEDFDCVIHCAANISKDEPFNVFQNNLTSTLNVVEACLASNVRKIFHTSGLPVIGKILELPITENHPVRPLTAYHYSKYESERVIEYFCHEKIDFINMRIPSPVGRYMPPRSMFPIFFERIKMGLDITLNGDSRRQMNYLDLRDLTNFICKASRVSGVSGVFNVAAKKPYSDRAVAEAIISRMGSKSKIVDNSNEANLIPQKWEISTEKAKVNFGYTVEYSLCQTIDWLVG